MTETNPKTEEITEITEITEVVTASEALKPTEIDVAPKIKKNPSQAKLDALERARSARSEKAKEKRALLLKAAQIVSAKSPATPPPPAKDLNYFLEVHKEGLAAFPEYESLVKPPEILDLPARPVLKFV